MTDRSTGTLLREFRDGDTASFEQLVERFEGPLLRYARFLPRESLDAEDLVQETFLRLATRPPDLPSEVEGNSRLEQAHLASWLFRVTRNCAMGLVRSDTRRSVRERAYAPAEATDDGLAVVTEKETRFVVEKAIATLTPDQREVVVLRLLGERSYREIAEITGRKAGTVSWLISAGIEALSRQLNVALDVERPTLAAQPKGGSKS